uniref:Scavenger receptor cysteine-rich type 1 protein M130-like n=1 Tax=Cynoglossus semilaevis TaxID=244447 RepID=A0A3P8VET0_CYNSE
MKIKFAAVLCRQMDCGSLLSIKFSTNSSEARAAWELNFTCQGSEASLRECDSEVTRSRVHSVDSSTSSLDLVCAESVRMVETSPLSCSGTVEVRSGHGWLPVCEEGLTSFAQNLVCSELGCGPADSSRTSSEQKIESVLTKQFFCQQNESRLEECTSSTRDNCRPISRINCSPEGVQLRLVGGESSCRGRLEGKKEREWMPLTGWRFFEPENTHRACHMLGCGDTIAAARSALSARQRVWQFDCYDRRSSFCSRWDHYISDNGITLTCSDSVRLKNRGYKCQGEVLVKSDDAWVPACSNFFSRDDAHVVCRDLGCGFADSHYSHMGNNRHAEMIWAPEFRCEGTEPGLAHCPSAALNASHTQLRECENVQVTCLVQPRVPHLYLRSVQQQDHFHKGRRFTIICTHDFPRVVTFRLSAENNTVLQTVPPNGKGQGVFIFPAEAATGQITFKCDYSYDFSPELFSEKARISVEAKELPDVRLVGEGGLCLGRLEVQNEEQWRPVSHQHSWTMKEAGVVCRQLGCGLAALTKRVDLGAHLQSVWRFFSDCQGSEPSLMDCGIVKKWVASAGVEVICSDILLQPNITFYSGLGVEQQKDIWVFRGHSFTVHCSAEPQYPDGHFSLIFIGSNQTHTFSQPAVDHTALFKFPTAELLHQGNYTCVYHNSIFSQNFSSPQSESVFLTVTDNDSLWLYNEDEEVEEGQLVCAGQVIVGHPMPLPLSADSTVWDMKHAAIVCRQLGCGPPVSTRAVALTDLTSVWHFFSDCDGSESVLLDCGATRQWFSSSVVEVVCAGEKHGHTHRQTDRQTHRFTQSQIK